MGVWATSGAGTPPHPRSFTCSLLACLLQKQLSSWKQRRRKGRKSKGLRDPVQVPGRQAGDTDRDPSVGTAGGGQGEACQGRKLHHVAGAPFVGLEDGRRGDLFKLYTR